MSRNNLMKGMCMCASILLVLHQIHGVTLLYRASWYLLWKNSFSVPDASMGVSSPLRRGLLFPSAEAELPEKLHKNPNGRNFTNFGELDFG